MWVKKAKMSVREAMIEIAGKPGHGEQLDWFDTIAEASNLSARAVRSLWRNEISDDNHRAAIAVRRAAQEAKRDREIAKARQEASALANQYQQIVGGMRARDEDFFSAEIARLERLIRVIGSLNSPGT